jgi:hypothetical protein
MLGWDGADDERAIGVAADEGDQDLHPDADE